MKRVFHIIISNTLHQILTYTTVLTFIADHLPSSSLTSPHLTTWFPLNHHLRHLSHHMHNHPTFYPRTFMAWNNLHLFSNDKDVDPLVDDMTADDMVIDAKPLFMVSSRDTNTYIINV